MGRSAKGLFKTMKVRNGDTVMICRHIFEQARQGNLTLPERLGFQGRFDPPRAFDREDGTSGKADFVIACCPCTELPEKEVVYIEERYNDGLLHVADFCAGVHGWPT